MTVSVSGVRAAQGSLQSGVRDFSVRLSYALVGCLDLLFKVSFSGSPGLPKIFLPVTTEQLLVLSIALWRWFMAGIFGKILLYYFLMFPLVRSSFHRGRKICCGCSSLLVYFDVSNLHEDACSSG